MKLPFGRGARALWRGCLLAFVLLLSIGSRAVWAQSSDTPITRAARITGYINFVTTGGSLRTQSNSGNACLVGSTSSENLTGIPLGTTVQAAYLYWGGSGSTIDSAVIFNGSTISANRTFTATYDNAGTLLPFFGGFADVTSLVTGNGSYTFGGLTVNTGAPHCGVAAVAAGWGLIVIYQGGSERLRAINVYDGLQFFRGSALTLNPDGFRVPPSNIDGRIAVLTWEGDPGNSNPLNGFSESLTFNGTTIDDGINVPGSDPTVQQFDGTINSQNVSTSYGVDVDIYDISSLVTTGQTSATTVYSAGGDLVMLTAQIVSVTTEPEVDLAVVKSHSGSFTVGSTGTYTITVSNAVGRDREDNIITVTDTLPAGLSYASASGAGWSCNAVGQVVTCTHAPSINAGAALPDLLLTVNVAAAAYPSVTNNVGVDSASFDVNTSNDSTTDATNVIAPDLSSSTKSVVDLNGGEANPGDVLRYTITLTESGGVAASNVTVTDDAPGNTTGFAVVSVPAGATNASTGAGTGANGVGFLNVTGVAVPANGSATVVFDVAVAAAATPGTPINNTATINNPGGPGATPSAPQVLVSPSQIPSSGQKPLYLRRLPALQLSRTPPTAAEVEEVFNASLSRTWTLTPALQLPISIPANNIPVRLWLRRTGNNNSRTLVVTLSNSVTGVIGSSTQTLTLPSGANPPQEFLFTIPNNIVRSFPAGSALTLDIAQTAPTNANQSTRVHPNGPAAGQYSRVDLTSNTVIDVNSVQAFSAAYPGGVVLAAPTPGSTVYMRAVISDPFGSFDIANARITIVDPNNVTQVSSVLMTQVADSGAATRTYEYAYPVPAAAAIGGWTVRVVGTEGTEGLVTDLGVGSFLIQAPQPALTVLKSSTAFSDPLNNTTNPKRIPQGVVRYEITVTNTGPGTADANSLAITDRIPANTALYVATVPSNPIEFIDGSTASGLGFAYGSAVSYSNQPSGGAPFDYTPVPDADGFDVNVRGLRVAPSGTMSAASGANTPSFTIRFRVRVQ
jgi:uncharacterized repeat protein (TIGR01451 family)